MSSSCPPVSFYLCHIDGVCEGGEGEGLRGSLCNVMYTRFYLLITCMHGGHGRGRGDSPTAWAMSSSCWSASAWFSIGLMLTIRQYPMRDMLPTLLAPDFLAYLLACLLPFVSLHPTPHPLIPPSLFCMHIHNTHNVQPHRTFLLYFYQTNIIPCCCAQATCQQSAMTWTTRA